MSDDFNCVVCGTDEPKEPGWIFPIEDSNVVEINEDGLQRELVDDSRPICSIDCKNEFEERQAEVQEE